MTFKAMYKAGQCSLSIIDELVDIWHKGNGLDQSLRDFLGLTDEEFQTWLTGGDAALARLLNEGGEPEYHVVHLDWDDLRDQLQDIVNSELGEGYDVQLQRLDYYFWDMILRCGKEISEEESARICERLGIQDMEKDVFCETDSIDSSFLKSLLSRLTGREVESSHADEHGVYIISKKLAWSSPEFVEQLIANCEKRLWREIKSHRYPLVNPDTACHQLFGFIEALKRLGLVDRNKWDVYPDHFSGSETADVEKA